MTAPLAQIEPAPSTQPSAEELTYRQGAQRLAEFNFLAINEKFDAFTTSVTSFIARAEQKAQFANDALQTLLEAITDRGLENTREALRNVETRIAHARELAAESASALDSRVDRAVQRQSASTEMLEARLAALTQISELRDEVNRSAITRTEQALERRLDALSEYNNATNLNEQNFVTRPVMEARVDRVSSQLTALENAIVSINGRMFIAVLALLVILSTTQILIFKFLQ